MAKSVSLIADITTVVNNGPSAVTTAKSIAQAGPIMDYPGTTKSVQLQLQALSVAVGLLVTGTDAGSDATNLGLFNGVQALLKGTSTPSVALIADLTTAMLSGPSAVTTAKSIAQAGPIMDYVGMTHNVRKRAQDIQQTLVRVLADTDAGSDGTNLGLLQNVQNTLV